MNLRFEGHHILGIKDGPYFDVGVGGVGVVHFYMHLLLLTVGYQYLFHRHILSCISIDVTDMVIFFHMSKLTGSYVTRS